MKEVSIKKVQYSLQKIIIWTKNCGKGKHEWVKACKDASIHPQKLKIHVKTRFASKVILFKETLELKHIDTPPSSLIYSTASPKVKTTKGEGVGRVLWLLALWG
jgi:hypothetical protein